MKDIRQEIIETIVRERLIVIVRGIEKSKLIPLSDAMYEGGVRLLEITYSTDGKVTDEETAESIKQLSEHFKGRMHIGAGTVVTKRQVKLTKEAGGEFIIAPDTNPKVIEKTISLDMVSIPGALTPTEICTAHRCGADFVKLFPVTSLGTEYVKAIKAPLSGIKLLAVGGVNDKNMGDYLKTGISGFGVGSNIIDKKLLEKEDYSAITELAKRYVNAAKGE